MLTDAEIARNAKPQKIYEIAKKLGYTEDEIECYGKYKAKLPAESGERKAKLILVTAMNPTPLGEGKTTVSIGLADALSLLGKNACLALREPSLGPVFGIKGGACGGGYSQVIPMEDINLHFNGDFHAITYANNLLSTIIDNHIKQGNALGFSEVAWNRCIDLNDRALREIEIGLGSEVNGPNRKDGFVITAASEIMAVLCLSKSLADMKERLSKIVAGYTASGKEITAGDLKAEEAMTVLLKDAIKPNLVQTLEGTPAIIHGGPFANIAHGCNSVIATSTAMARSDYTVTEAGFGAELGGEKFLDIKCRLNDLTPSCCVLVVTCRSIKFNGGVAAKDAATENLNAIIKGFSNIERHISNLKRMNCRVVIAINRFIADTDKEIALIKDLCEKSSASVAVITNFVDGGKGAVSLAEEVIRQSEMPLSPISFNYELTDGIKEKIAAVAEKIYGAKRTVFSEKALKQIARAEENPVYKSFPVCIAKTQYSFSCDATALGAPRDFDFEVREIAVRSGAGFIVAVSGKMLLMPGLPAVPNSEKISIDGDGNIFGLS